MVNPVETWPGEAGLRYWVTERQAIYAKRAAGLPAPWTADPILRSYHFCNVFRDLDRTTVWLLTNLYEPLKKTLWEDDLWMLAAIVRFINHVPTLEALLPRVTGYREDWFDTSARGAIRATFAERAAVGAKLYGNAYMIRADSGKPKVDYLLDAVWAPLWRDRAMFRQLFNQTRASVTRATEAFANAYGLGGFMAYEITTDLTYTRLLGNATDRYTYAHLGPGAVRGLDRVVGRELRAEERLDVFIALLIRLQREQPIRDRQLFARDLEHSLCEFDKYERLRTGGTYQRRYRPGGASTEKEKELEL